MEESRRIRVFLVLTGQYTNIGDSMHRRVLVRWLCEKGEVHAFVGRAPREFVDSLELDEGVVLYRSCVAWVLSAIFGSGRMPVFSFCSGECNIGPRRLFAEFGLLGIQIFFKIKGGQVWRIGVALSSIPRKLAWAWRIMFYFSDRIIWRTNRSQIWYGRGEVAPDLAFCLADAPKNFDGSSRSWVTISLRADRPLPTGAWFDVIRAAAEEHCLNLIIVSQVSKDNERVRQLAQIFGVDGIVWERGTTHLQHEERLRNIYRQSRVVLSDRLHVLIAAWKNGAMPLIHRMDGETGKKAIEHFATAGVNVCSLDASIIERAQVEMNLVRSMQFSKEKREDDIFVHTVLRRVKESLIEDCAERT